MKVNQQQYVPNKKLILHFDVDGVLRLPSRKNKDLYVQSILIHRCMICVQAGFGVNWRKIVRKIRIKLQDGNLRAIPYPSNNLNLRPSVIESI